MKINSEIACDKKNKNNNNYYCWDEKEYQEDKKCWLNQKICGALHSWKK